MEKMKDPYEGEDGGAVKRDVVPKCKFQNIVAFAHKYSIRPIQLFKCHP
jgi:hypothetical protein